MSFTGNQNGKGYAPGWFLKNADCVRETRTVSASHAAVATAANGGKYVPMGSFWPANDSSTVKGILYEDVDVTTGDMPGSVVTSGEVYLDRLPASPESGVQNALEALGFKFTATTPAAVRPTSFGVTELGSITVASTEGTGSGKTDVAVSGYTLGAGERYCYKIAQTTAPAVALGEILPTSGSGAWTVAAFPLDELTATDGYKITVAVIDSTGAAVAAGNATLDVKA